MSEKFIALDLDDEKSLKIAEVISSKTCKIILNSLADKEMSESEIANELKIPLNTAHYNIKKLVGSGLVVKKAGFLWSVKGRKIEKYKLANKRILISPKRMTKGVVPALIASVLVTVLIKLYTSTNFVVSNLPNTVTAEKSNNLASSGASAIVASPPGAAGAQIISNIAGASNIWAWFLLGALFAILVYLIYDLIAERGLN